MDLRALGDFAASNSTSETLPGTAGGRALAFPADTRALEAAARSSGLDFIGYGERRGDRLQALLLPDSSPCEVFRPGTQAAYPRRGGGEGLGYSASSGVMLMAGSNDATSAAIVGALSFDTQSGDVSIADPAQRAVLTEPRAFASVSDFAGQLLVAGGENPIHDVSESARILRDTAEVFDPATVRFEPELVELAEGRTEHSAVTLESGETLLIGGRGSVGDALSINEVVAPGERASHVVGALREGRIAPSVLRLDDGRVLVGAGRSADGRALGSLECLTADATQSDARCAALELPPRFDRAFAALPGGAAIAVGGCEDRTARPGEECSALCRLGCPPASYDAFWITPDGSVEELRFPIAAPHPILLPGSDGAPWLIASVADASGAAIPNSYALFRFDPWRAEFTRQPWELGFSGPALELHAVSLGADAFAWLDSDADSPVLHTVRFGTRGPFAEDPTLVAYTDPLDPTRPAHLAPDHAPGAGVSYDGALHFSAGAASCVWITDTTYADFTLEIAASTAPPRLRLGTTELGGAACPWPDADTGQPLELTVTRTGSTLSLSRGQAVRSCSVAQSRAALGVCGSLEGDSSVERLSVTRR